ncbi:arginine--tRNA ligase [Rhodobacter capsulatus]|uniref:Arginine--tRNA ligase n=1 Tax=Rhodobacter capsulatus (strain ATCC BAA-309 / NBRC 16581 / SB1003) TaxID=272942 RepID=D5AQ32_RHOCB|nr:arginine--tRNA ligase [Rhodobacter capsulatus]ADE84619.1 arginyl-tRNA synthetase [Rhodobacter capsulatus SB 1003]ETD02583.1 arginyl-tRNA synthetase [Rhodobacter capsulatus DE442]ETD78681.1 arginyl-tRNA synthetase [Rhodobacter capsulatus R121]ETD91580.1 arginyl-tRNA synthetase [Rhodobacter capsulatus YW2]ETE54647.1 arginyl-tRNA synthetase [Rhodobacter capsulatus Y262]
MNLFADVRAVVLAALDAMVAEGALPAGLDTQAVAVEPPRDAAHGDMATNAAMVLAKPAGTNPRALAEGLVAKLAADARIVSAEVAGPGFINLRLAPGLWADVVRAALTAGSDFGRSTLGRGIKVNVEYVSANPTGPMHVGHTRGAVFGDALASLLDFAGYDVTREYYINDGGAQVDVLARSAYERYREANGLEPEIREGLYPGDYLIPVGEALKEKYGASLIDKPESDWLAEVRVFATEAMMAMIREDLALLGVKMDVFYSEKSLYGTGQIEAALQRLQDLGLIYEGVLEPPKGKLPEDWEEREQTLFRSTSYGDDVDRPVKKSDGAWTYFAPDIAYHWTKIERGFDQLIDVFGADHGGYVKRMKAAVAALSENRVPLDIKLIQLVKLFKNGEPFKMSKRAGTFVTLRDVVEQAGAGVTRFHMLTRKNDAPLDFDFDKVLEQSKDNPVFYVQYAHARVASVLRKAVDLGIDVTDAALAAADLDRNTHEAERALAKKIAEWPRQVEIAARANEPHRVAFFLYEIASDLHALWNRGNDEPSLRFLQEGDLAASSAKIALARASAVVISAGLGILGVTPAEEMR